MPDDFYTPTDADMLRMENDLLSFEAGFLRARIIAVDEEIAAVVREKDQERAQLESRLLEASRQAAEDQVVVDRTQYELMKTATGDIRWLVRRLARSPIGWALRRWGGWRVMEERWLE